MESEIVIITDDFTSAMDNGVSFSKFGLKTGVILDNHYIEESLKEFDVLVINTESRHDSKEKAFRKVSKVVKILKNSKITYIYKSIDSTLRGNIGKEIEAAMIASERRIAIVAPAYPINGRTTLGGIQLFNWIPLEKTEFSKDPINPVSFSSISNIIASQTNKRIININLQDVMKGPKQIATIIKKLSAEGYEIFIIDAITDQDLINISRSIFLIEKCVIIGSTGLIQFIPKAINIIKNEELKKGNVLVVAGSVNSITRDQVKWAIENLPIEVIDVNIKNIFSSQYREEIDEIMKKAKIIMDKGKDVIICSAKDRSSLSLARKMGKKVKLNYLQTSERIACFLGEIATLICKKAKPKGIVLTGGDISIKTVKMMGITKILIQEEILPGIPCGYFIDEKFKNLKVVVKAGGFGQKDALEKIIRYIKES